MKPQPPNERGVQDGMAASPPRPVGVATAEMVRTHDWSRTPLGPIGRWPPSLRTLTGLVLEHPMPTILLWGPQLIQIYNDAYALLAGAKHPAAMGMPTRECWPEVWQINQPIYERVLSRGEPVLREDALYPLERFGRSEDVYLTISYSAARDDAGQIAGVFITIQEATEKVRAQRRLRQSEAMLAEAQEVAHVGSWNWDLRASEITWSAEHYRIVGLRPRSGPVPAERAVAYIHPDDRAAALEAINEAIHVGGRYERSLRVVREDGAVRIAESRGRVVHDPAGQPLRMVGTLQDVTEREEALAALRVANARLDLAIRGSNIGVWDVDLPRGTLDAARLRRTNLVEQFGYPPDAGDVPADDAMALVHPDDRARVADTFAGYLTGARREYEVEHRLRHADGSYRWVLSRGVAVRDAGGRPVRLIGTTTDVTERKRAEEERAALVAHERAAAERERLLEAERAARAEAERRARETEEARSILQTVFDNLPEGVVLTGGPPDFQILANSRHVQDLIGRPVDTAVGARAGSHAAQYGIRLPDGSTPRPQDMPLYRASHGERVRNVELLIERPDGSRLPVLVDAAPVRDSQGRLIGAVNCWRDITERKRVEEVLRGQAALAESRRRLDAALLAGAVGTWEWDVDADRIWGDETFGRIFDIAGDATGAAPLDAYLEAVHPGDRDRVAASVSRCVESGCDYEAEYRMNEEGGRRPSRWVLARGKPQREASGRVVRLPGVVIDVTERKRAEAALARAKEAAEQANRVKDEFLAVLSHELRTPLAAILLWGRLLANGTVTDDEDRTRAVRSIIDAAQAQDRLMGDLLDVSRMAAGTFQLDRRDVDLDLVLLAVVDATKPAADAKGVRLSVDVPAMPVTVRGDPGRLRQVVANLLTNAVKFTPSGGRVDVRLARAGPACITVRDTGRGIAPEFLPHVFERFRQADASITRMHGGLGLGLAIVRELVALHGGSVTAASEGEALGASFTVDLPLADVGRAASPSGAIPGEADRAGAAAAGARPLAGVRVLLVEDEPDMREALTYTLTAGGARVVATDCAAAAMEALAGPTPHVLVSDIGLPGEDGYSFIRRARESLARRGGPAVPALALTAYARPEDRERAIDAGFDAYAAKPVDMAELLRTVASLAGRN